MICLSKLGYTDKHIDDLKLRLDGNLDRFQEPKTLVVRMRKKTGECHFYGDREDEAEDEEDNGWYDYEDEYPLFGLRGSVLPRLDPLCLSFS